MKKIIIILFVCTTVFPGIASADLLDGLVAHWNLDEGSGTEAFDSVGTYDGYFVANPEWVTGLNGGYALYFEDEPGEISLTIGYY